MEAAHMLVVEEGVAAQMLSGRVETGEDIYKVV